MPTLKPLLILLSSLFCLTSQAGPLEDRVKAALAAPEEIVRAAPRLALSQTQIDGITEDALRTEAALKRLQAQAMSELSTLGVELARQPINAAQAELSFNKLLAIENQIKQMRLALWIRANQQLSAAQRSTLKTLKQ